MKMKNGEPKLSNTKQSKKAYHQPQLQVYGDLRDITKPSESGAKDGGKGCSQKTH